MEGVKPKKSTLLDGVCLKMLLIVIAEKRTQLENLASLECSESAIFVQIAKSYRDSYAFKKRTHQRRSFVLAIW